MDAWPSGMDSISQFMTNETSDSRHFRWGVCSEVYSCAMDIEGVTEKKKELVWLLTTRLNDRSSTISGAVLSWLSDFNAASFNESAKQNVKALFDAKMSRNTILLMGIVDQEYCLSKTSPLIEQADLFGHATGRFWGKAVWAALLVHAKAGDSRSVDIVLNALKHEPSESFRVKKLFRDLGYTLHPKAVEYLKAQVIADKTVPGGRDYSALSYAQEACLVLSTMLENFPERAGRLYTRSEIDHCKAWLLKQTEWRMVQH